MGAMSTVQWGRGGTRGGARNILYGASGPEHPLYGGREEILWTECEKTWPKLVRMESQRVNLEWATQRRGIDRYMLGPFGEGSGKSA